MTDPSPERDQLAQLLAENGISETAPDGLHSWRCEHPDRYGPCDCRDELVNDLLQWLAVHDGQIAESAWDEGFNAGVSLPANCALGLGNPSNPYRADQIEGAGE